MQVLKQIVKWTARVLAAVLALIVLAVGGLHIAKFFIYPDYYDAREKVAAIPDLNRGFTPQGLGYGGDGVYLMSGYFDDHTAIYLVKGNSHKKIVIKTPEGELFKGHAGGIAKAGEYVYVSDGNALYRFSYADLIAAEDDAELTYDEIFRVQNSASFCFADSTHIYVGEFYRAGNYETDLSHAYTTPEGEEHRAIAEAYPLSSDGTIASSVPEFAISLPHQVQGFAYVDGYIALSTSWGVSTSHLLFYDGKCESGETIALGDHVVPLYYVGQANLVEDVSIPPFAEGLCVADGRVQILFESASNKSIIGKFFFANYAVSYPVPAR